MIDVPSPFPARTGPGVRELSYQQSFQTSSGTYIQYKQGYDIDMSDVLLSRPKFPDWGVGLNHPVKGRQIMPRGDGTFTGDSFEDALFFFRSDSSHSQSQSMSRIRRHEMRREINGTLKRAMHPSAHEYRSEIESWLNPAMTQH